MERVFGGVEGGGTKFVCVLGTTPEHIIDESRFPTTSPEETLGRVVDFFQRSREDIQLAAVGVASFGPIDLDHMSPSYGFITTTPKALWPHTNVVGTLQEALGVPIGWDTDVNGAALGERRWGAGKGADPLVYITVGTGIGGGAVVNGQPLHGLIHPEMGHLLMPVFDGDTFKGICPYHGRCLEGIASGTALHARLGRSAEGLQADDPVWDLEAQYLAAGVLSIAAILSPERFVIGGGVASAPGLFPRLHQHLVRLNNGYLNHPNLAEDVASYVVSPGLGALAGALGALELARRAVDATESE